MDDRGYGLRLDPEARLKMAAGSAAAQVRVTVTRQGSAGDLTLLDDERTGFQDTLTWGDRWHSETRSCSRNCFPDHIPADW